MKQQSRKTQQQKIKVKYVSRKVLHDFDGMNNKAGKQLGFKPKVKKNEILVAKDLPKAKKAMVKRHEKAEIKEMAKGKTYWNAHKSALKKERKKR